jgi:DNA invertase Pin-like site-specific DNA recombinase
MSKRHVAYVRVSTDRQSSGLEAQKMALENYFRQKGITDFDFYEDFAISGRKENRPSLNKLMEEVRCGNIESITVYSFSRFARSTRHLLEAMDLFKRLSVNFISISENIDTSTAMGKAMFTIISAISTLEADLIRERVMNGLASARQKGKKLGRDKTINEELIRTLASNDYSYREIAKLAKCSIASVSRTLKVTK